MIVNTICFKLPAATGGVVELKQEANPNPMSDLIISCAISAENGATESTRHFNSLVKLIGNTSGLEEITCLKKIHLRNQNINNT